MKTPGKIQTSRIILWKTSKHFVLLHGTFEIYQAMEITKLSTNENIIKNAETFLLLSVIYEKHMIYNFNRLGIIITNTTTIFIDLQIGKEDRNNTNQTSVFRRNTVLLEVDRAKSTYLYIISTLIFSKWRF